MYMNFIENYFHPTEEELTILKQQETIDLYLHVQDQGGFIKVSLELFQYYSQQYNKFLNQDNFERLKIFQKYLLNYELQTQTIDGSYLQRAKHLEDYINCFTLPPEMWLTEQTIVWTIPEAVFQEFNKNLFTLDDISRNHGRQFVDIRIQNPQTNQLEVVKENYYQAYSLKLKDFIKYTKNQQIFLRNHPEYSQDKVLQAVNIDMEGWKKELKRFFEYLPHPLIKNSGLKYLRQNCPGTNIPEIYIRVDGSWVGGQQECQGLNLLNINHGPGECIWLTIDADYVYLLEKIVPDLYKNEGLWYVEIEFFLENKIPIKQTIQKCGDIIFLGAGCFYLIKNVGTTLSTSFNFLLCNEYSLKQIYNRQLMNDLYNIGCVVPIKNLLLDIFIHNDIPTLDTLLLKFVEEELDMFLLKKQNIKTCRIQNDSKDVLQCTNCKREIFLLFQFIDDWVFYCIWCAEGENIYMKYHVNQLICLIKSGTKICSKSYCSNYVGNTQCKVQNKLLLSDSDQILEDLILDCQEQSSSTNQIKNDDYESEIEKLQAKIQEIKNQHKRQILKLRKYSSEASVIKYIRKTKKQYI